MDRVAGELGRLDILVNNAGAFLLGPLEQLSLEEFESLSTFPLPHPDLRPQNPPADAGDEDVTALGWTIGIALGFGLPVAVVLGIIYGAWWSLAVPVAVSVVLLYAEHLLTPEVGISNNRHERAECTLLGGCGRKRLRLSRSACAPRGRPRC